MITISSACNKIQEKSNINNLRKTKSNYEFIEEKIKYWMKSVDGNPLLSVIQKKQIKEWAKNIDISNSRIIKSNYNESEIILDLNVLEQEKSLFINLRTENEKQIFTRLFKTNGSIKSIQHFILSKEVIAGERIEEWGITNMPIKAWEKTKTGKSLNKKIVKKVKKQNKESNLFSNHSEVDEIRSNRIVDPEENECIDWYWIVYDADTNEILYEEYIFSTGNCGGNGNSQTTSLNPNSCNFTEEEAEDLLESFQETYTNEVFDEIAGVTTIQNDNTFEQSFTKSWKFGSVRLGYGSFAVQYIGIAH